MFWGCFSRQAGKSLGIFWEKDCGTITSEGYYQHIVPIVHGWLTMNPNHSFMQDNASSHASAATITKFEERGIQLVR
jgi:hypothetical protein